MINRILSIVNKDVLSLMHRFPELGLQHLGRYELPALAVGCRFYVFSVLPFLKAIHGRVRSLVTNIVRQYKLRQSFKNANWCFCLHLQLRV